MKNNENLRKTDYDQIKRKLYAYILTALIAAAVIVILIRMLSRGNFADAIVGFIVSSSQLDYDTALTVYQLVIRNNLVFLLFVAMALCFLFLCRFIFSRFMRYFDEVNAGIDSLIRADGKPIEFSPEMAFMEQKINMLRQTLEKREQEAKLAEQRKNDLVMYLAHDIKTPLTSVVGYLSLLDEAADMPAVQKAKYVHITLEKAYRLEHLIDEFFEITRYNLHTITLAKKNIDLHYMLLQMADEFYPQLSAGDKQAVIQAPEELTIYGDPDKLARVFNNILKNAVAYSLAHSTIEIKAEGSDGGAAVVFTNAGGIPRDKLDHIFDKFYRLDAARSTDTGGAGLGLAVAKEIVAAHGGRIYADSDGTQTSFTVELPIMPPHCSG